MPIPPKGKRAFWSTEQKQRVLEQGRIERKKDPDARPYEILARAQLVLPKEWQKSIRPNMTSPSQPIGKWFTKDALLSDKPVKPIRIGRPPKELGDPTVLPPVTPPAPPKPGPTPARLMLEEFLQAARDMLTEAIEQALERRAAHAPPLTPPVDPPAPAEPPKPAPEDMRAPPSPDATDPRERYIAACTTAGIPREVAERLFDSEKRSGGGVEPAANEPPALNGNGHDHGEGVTAQWPEPEDPPPPRRHDPTMPSLPREKQPVILVLGLKARQAQELEAAFGHKVRLRVHARGDGPRELRQRTEGATDAIVTAFVPTPVRAMLKARLGKEHVDELHDGELATGVRRILQRHVDATAAAAAH